MVSPVTDPSLLAKLEGSSSQQATGGIAPVTDPRILAQLEGGAEAPQTQPEQRSTMDELGRQLGLTGRAIVGGAAQAVQPFTEPVRYLLDKAGVPGQEYSTEQNLDAVMTKAGVPEPETSTERGVQGVGRFVASLAGGAGETALANKVAGVKPRMPNSPTPTTDELADRAGDAYKAVDESGVVYRPLSANGLANRVASRMKNEGIDPDIHPGATKALKRIVDAGEGALDIKKLDTLRQIVKDVGSSNSAGERRLSKIMSTMIDDFVENAGAGDAIAGNPKEAAKQLSKARDLWKRKSKAETIEALFDVADINKSTYSASGFENALRTKFKQLARNTKQMRQFTPEEQAAIKQVAIGGKMDNALRMLGKLAPRGVISGGLMPVALANTLGPEAAMAITGAGEVGRRAATSRTLGNAEKALDMMRRGSPTPQQAGTKPIPPWMLPSVIALDEGAYEGY